MLIIHPQRNRSTEAAVSNCQIVHAHTQKTMLNQIVKADTRTIGKIGQSQAKFIYGLEICEG